MNKSQALLGLLIPRPHSFLMNSLLFGVGVLFAWLEGYRGSDGGTLDLPAWLFFLLWFIVQELCVQQAKYMGNDIRDHERDQDIPANCVRPIARQPLSNALFVVMVGRWLLGITLAALLSPSLLAVVLLISGLQVVYELLAKPHAGARPLLPLYIVGAGMVLKTCSGALALGVPAGEQRFWLYGLALFATGVVFVSSFWRVEAAYFVEHGWALPRGQSAYFARCGLYWLKAGTAVTIAAGTLLIFDGYTHFLTQVEISPVIAFGLIFAAGIVCCRLAFSLVRGSSGLRSAAILLYLSASTAYLLFRVDQLIPVPREAQTAVLLLILLLLDHRFNVNLDYRQQNLLYLLDHWPIFKRVVRERPSRISASTHWRDIIRLALALNSPRFDELRKQQQEALDPVY